MTLSHTSGWSTTSESFNCASEFNGAPINRGVRVTLNVTLLAPSTQLDAIVA